MLSEHADKYGVTIADFITDDGGAIIEASLPYCTRNLLNCIREVERVTHDRLASNTRYAVIIEMDGDKSLVDYYGLARKYYWPYNNYNVTLVECL